MKEVYLFYCFSTKDWRSHNYANVNSKGSPLMGEVVDVTTNIWNTQGFGGKI